MNHTLFPKNGSQNHSELEDLYFIDRLTNERINPNGETFPIDNELCTGKLMFMIRTCDADGKVDSVKEGGSATNDKVSNYLRPLKRRFERRGRVVEE